MNNITMKLNADDLILSALKEDITSEDITTNSVMPEYKLGEVELICKENGVIAGLSAPGATLTVALYVYAKEQGEFGVAFAIAAILMVLTVLINFAATLVQKHFEKRRNK